LAKIRNRIEKINQAIRELEGYNEGTSSILSLDDDSRADLISLNDGNATDQEEVEKAPEQPS